VAREKGPSPAEDFHESSEDRPKQSNFIIAPTPPQRDKRDRRTPLWEKMAAITVAAGTAGLLFVNIFQMKATQRAADVAVESIKPRLVIVNFGPQSLSGSDPQPLDKDRLHVYFQVPNYGPMPASNVRFRRFENVSPWSQVRRLPYGQLIWDYPQIIFPTTTSGPPGWGMTGDRIISSEEISGLVSHDLVATFSILIEYEDTSGKTHGVEYCGQFTFPPYTFSQPCPWRVRSD
jgi:hypothetical protein